MAEGKGSNAADNRFWLEIMGDYARFVLYALPITESNEIKESQRFISLFDKLLARAKDTPAEEAVRQLNQEAYRATQDIRKYFLHIIYRMITEDIIFNLHPTMINLMVNDTELYIDNLAIYLKNINANINSATISLTWLFNFYTTAIYTGYNRAHFF